MTLASSLASAYCRVNTRTAETAASDVSSAFTISAMRLTSTCGAVMMRELLP